MAIKMENNDSSDYSNNDDRLQTFVNEFVSNCIKNSL